MANNIKGLENKIICMDFKYYIIEDGLKYVGEFLNDKKEGYRMEENMFDYGKIENSMEMVYILIKKEKRKKNLIMAVIN